MWGRDIILIISKFHIFFSFSFLALTFGTLAAGFEFKYGHFEIKSQLTLISNEITEAESLLDCASKCVHENQCCKSSFIDKTKQCFLDTTPDCSEISVFSQDSIVVQRNKPGSCRDIYKQDPDVPDGKFVVYVDKPITVYCVFEENVGYTYISKTAYANLPNLTTFYDINTFAIIRHRTDLGVQKQVKVEQLEMYASQSLSFSYNTSSSYKGPSDDFKPFLFFGFLPIPISSLQSVQGYRANGVEFTFTNCDGAPNSYIAFFFLNPTDTVYRTTGFSTSVTHGWINSAEPLDSQQYMDEEFYFEYMINMGGCGGRWTSPLESGTLAALGLPFSLQ